MNHNKHVFEATHVYDLSDVNVKKWQNNWEYKAYQITPTYVFAGNL